MLGRKRRFSLLALLMVLLVGGMSAFSTLFLYRTALKEQRMRLEEMVRSQAALIMEWGKTVQMLRLKGGVEAGGHYMIKRMAVAHRAFNVEGSSEEFTVARRVGNSIRYVIVNGREVEGGDPLENVPLDSGRADPMVKALQGKTGTLLGLDYQGKEVVAAFTPLPLQREMLGLVAKIDVSEIKAPFVRANLVIVAVGLPLTLICLIIFYRVGEPLIHELEKSEEHYRALVEGVNALILRVDRDGIITFANDFANSLFSDQDGTLTGKPMAFLFDEVEDILSIKELISFFETHRHLTDIPMTKTDKHHGWFSWTTKPIMDHDEPVEMLCIGYDVTQAHLARTAHKEIEERFRGIAKASPVGIIITDLGGNLTYANERMHSMTGTTPADFMGHRWLESLHPEDRQKLRRMWLTGKTPESRRHEFRLMTPKGEPLWVLAQIVDLKEAKGEVYGNVITFTDISLLKEAELAQRQLTAAIEQAAEMIMITDLKANITYVNPAFEDVTRYRAAEVLGKNPRILNSGEQDREFYKEFWKTIKKGEIWSGRFINEKKDGQRFNQESTVGPIRSGKGQISGYVCVSRDITEQLEVEAHLRQSQKLESIGELAAGIAHEINTPTQYVSSNLQFLEEAFDTFSTMLARADKFLSECESENAAQVLDQKEIGYLSEDIPNALQESRQGLDHITKIVQSIKQLAHPGEVQKSYHDINVIVRDAATVSTNEWKYVADIAFELDESLPQINCLKSEIGQVVLNLIVNGAHAIASADRGDERGTITLRTYVDGEYAVITVSDTGTGIPQSVIGKIFDPFFTTKEVGKGTGQGLAITYNAVVNMHGGLVDVETEEGKGSTFIIKLPMKGEDQ